MSIHLKLLISTYYSQKVIGNPSNNHRSRLKMEGFLKHLRLSGQLAFGLIHIFMNYRAYSIVCY